MLKLLNESDNIFVKIVEGVESGEFKFIIEYGFILFFKIFENVEIFKKIFENINYKVYVDFVNIMFKYVDGFDDKGLYYEIFNFDKRIKVVKLLWLEKGDVGFVYYGIFKIMLEFIKLLIKNYVNELYEFIEIYIDF